MTQPESQGKVQVDRANETDLFGAMLALNGIFWALMHLAVERVADRITPEENVRARIANLILAGQLITRELSERC